MYEIIFHKPAKKQLTKLPKEIQIRILKTLERIRVRPHYFIKRIASSPYYRLRVGDYRVIIDIQNKKLIIFVVELGLRKNIYKSQ